MQNEKRHVIILFLKSIKTGQSAKKQCFAAKYFNLSFIYLDDDIW